MIYIMWKNNLQTIVLVQQSMNSWINLKPFAHVVQFFESLKLLTCAVSYELWSYYSSIITGIW